MKNNKPKYEQAKHEFENILFKLNRDTRFSNDKSPYNTVPNIIRLKWEIRSTAHF
ncbi:DUF2461 family protein [Leadbettera azotonutricia]